MELKRYVFFIGLSEDDDEWNVYEEENDNGEWVKLSDIKAFLGIGDCYYKCKFIYQDKCILFRETNGHYTELQVKYVQGKTTPQYIRCDNCIKTFGE